MPTYFPKRIEPKWQKYWLENKTFRAVDGSEKPKYYILDMFPYPSGAGLHVGHPEGYTATDILARYKRMKGFNVLHPMGWDAFGLPAEQYAVETNTHPRITTLKNIDEFRRQIQMLGFSYDWDREVSTTDPGYYRWTQWIFLQLYNMWYDAEQGRGRPISELPIPPAVEKAGSDAVREFVDSKRLAYVAEVPVNWCQALGTVLANEEVVNGKSERGNHPVVRMPMRQWMLRITAYAERLLADLDTLDWSDSLKEQQRNWIGKSEGAEVDFVVLPADAKEGFSEKWFAKRRKAGYPEKPEADVIRVFTTRPDTLFGATYMVLAPEHPLVDRLASKEQSQAVREYGEQSTRKSDLDRTDLAKTKTGVFTGAFAVNPVNGMPIPVWIADYVLMGYGTGAIMAVPAHDDRDFEFAQKFDLDIVEVVMDPAEMPKILLHVHEWLGEWERNRESAKDDRYLKVALLLNCGFDIEGFEEDQKSSVRDPLWREVRCYYDPEEGKGIAVSFLDDDFQPILAEYITQEPDTQLMLFTLDPDIEGDEEDEEIDDEDEKSYDEDDSDEAASMNLTITESPACSNEAEGHACAMDGTCCDEFDTAFTAPGVAVNSGLITGLPTAEAKRSITEWLAAKGLGRRTVNYKLRDWLFSRQRYWGEPFPVLLDDKDRHIALAESELPLQLPELADFKPTGTPDPPLSKAGDWLKVDRGGKSLHRETNTMPQWAGSCWYYLRYLDPNNDIEAWSKDKEKYWMPVDLYVGGAEHAVLHLLYSRFWHKALFDLGHVHTAEPFQRLVNQGMILGEMEFTGHQSAVGGTGAWISADEVVESEDQNSFVHRATGGAATPVKLDDDAVVKEGANWVLKADPKIRVDGRSYKMSKSRGNVINPDQVVEHYGADALRLYEMFMGPLEATKPWSMKGVEGIWRFLNRVWRVVMDEVAEGNQLNASVVDVEPTREQMRTLHLTIRGVTEDIDGMRFNTAISKLMEYVNFLTPLTQRPRKLVEPLVLLLAPFAPHLGEEIWQSMGHNSTLTFEPWPTFDAEFCKATEIEVVLQINNKVKSKLLADAGLDNDALIALARTDEKIKTAIAGKEIVKNFVVDSRNGKLVNFVVKG